MQGELRYAAPCLLPIIVDVTDRSSDTKASEDTRSGRHWPREGMTQLLLLRTILHELTSSSGTQADCTVMQQHQLSEFDGAGRASSS